MNGQKTYPIDPTGCHVIPMQAVLCLSGRASARPYLAIHREAVVLMICHGMENAGHSGKTEDISDRA